ncbi:MAG: AGE family epimerase/isomerase [Bradymonadia bacterium]
MRTLISLTCLLTLMVGCVDEDDPGAFNPYLQPDAGPDASPLDAAAEADTALEQPDSDLTDAVAADAAPLPADAVVDGTGPYAYSPPSGEVPESLSSEVWRRHYLDEVLPYWTMDEARGEPLGNFPTFRGMNGTIQGSRERRPRMLGRQTYAYAMGYLLTGDTELLELAHAGSSWILEHARDEARGGWHTLLNGNGGPQGDDAKYAQDTAYVILGLGAWYFVARDPVAEAAVLAGRDLLFDEGTYWDADNQRIRDAMSPDLTTEVDQGSDGGWELVAQLDPINAFMLLTQPVLSEASRQDQFLDDMQTLAQTMIDAFWSDGIFWGIHNQQGQYGGRHVDFGHTLKTYWMILQIDKRLEGHPFQSFLFDHVHDWVIRAYDVEGDRWAKRPTGPATVEYGSDWWIYAEADQITATLNLLDHRYTRLLSQTGQHWLSDYVDATFGEVISGIRRDGQKVFAWPATDTAKCNQWKNGYHSTEHALIMYLHGRHLEEQSVTLYFAVPEAEVESFVARPYIFEGREVSRMPMETFEVGGRTLRKVAVEFVELY